MKRNAAFVIFCVLLFTIVNCDNEKHKTRVCVIGAGIAGLTSARYLQEEGIAFTVLEATRYVGGTWRYDPRVGSDEYGQPLHTSMYKHLRTNLPKPTMELRGFPIPDGMPSFPSHQSYYKYIKSYAQHFDLEKNIKFLHLVTSVSREGNVWKVKHKYLPTGEEFDDEYDYVIVGTGHFRKPHLPNMPGEKIFQGTIIHSHDYRTPEPYTGRRVLIVGLGPSGLDISMEITNVSRTLFHSQHSPEIFSALYPDNYVRKPDVQEFNETGVLFKDGTFEEVDDVVYCTGYEFDLAFLDSSSGLSISPKSVGPLYRHMVNIQQPSMLLLGLLVRACFIPAIDAQSRYATAIIKGNFTLPTKERMFEDWQRRVDELKSQGSPISNIHFIGRSEDKYYAELTEDSGIERVPPVMFKIRWADGKAKTTNLYTYRNYEYTITDNETFTRNLEVRNSL